MITDEKVSQRLLLWITRPLVKYCLRHSHGIRDVIAALKINFVEIAEQEINRSGVRSNASRISVLTGVHRTDVAQILKQRELPQTEKGSIIIRVMGQWRHDKRFSLRQGKPRILTHEGPDSEFHALVTAVTKNIHPAAVLRELERSGFVRKTRRGVKLLLQLTSLRRNPEEGYKLLSKDLDTLTLAAEENLLSNPPISNLHIRTEYDNVVLKEVPNIKIWLRDEGKAFHKRAREFISQYDKDINHNLESEEGGGYVALGAFSWVDLERRGK